MMRLILTLLLVVIAVPATAQTCFINQSTQSGTDEVFEANMQVLMMAHSPIEYRNSCGLRDESDQRFYEAIRAQVGCDDNADYAQFFGQYLEDQEEYTFARTRTQMRTDESFELYCKIVERVDLESAVNDDGTINAEALQVQAPLLQTLQLHVAEWSLLK